MTIQMAVDIVREVLTVSLTVIAPLIVAAIGTGLFISILQSVTSIQEQTLTFVPKLVVVALVMVAVGNWMAVEITDFAEKMFRDIQNMSP